MESAWYSDQKESSDEDEEKASQPPKKWVPAPIVPGRPPEALIEEMLKSPESNKDDEDDEEKDEDETASEKPSVESAAAEPTTTEAEPGLGDESTQAEVETGAEQMTAEAGEVPAPEYTEEPIEIPLRPRQENQEAAPPAQTIEESEPDEPPALPTLSGGGFPPPPPINPPVESAPAEQPELAPSPVLASLSNWNTHPVTANTAPRNTLTEQLPVIDRNAEKDAEKRGLRRGLVAGFITGYVLKAYLDGRKLQRYEKATSKQISQQEEQITRMQREQQQLNERLKSRAEIYAETREQFAANRPARFEKPEEQLPQVETAEEEPMFDQEGNQIILQPGWHVERSAGGYSVVLDEHNRVVYDAINYGEAYRRDKRREQLRVDTFAATDAGLPPAIGGVAGTVVNTPTNDPAPRAEYGMPAIRNRVVDVQHRLPEPRNNLLAAVASPWLWTAVAILLIVYFIAALS